MASCYVHVYRRERALFAGAVGIWDWLARAKHWSFSCHWASLGIQCMDASVSLWTDRVGAAIHAGSRSLAQVMRDQGLFPQSSLGMSAASPSFWRGGFHLIWHNADAWSLPRLGTAARWTGCLEMLHAGNADSAPGGISLNPTSTAGFTSSCTPRVSLCCFLCFGDAMWGHQHQLRGHIWHGAVFIYSGAMLRQSCCGLCRAELAWEQSAHVYVALTPANLTRWRCPCSWGVRIQLWVSRSKQVLMC